MRPNGPLRVALSSPEALTLHAESRFATSFYEDILGLIQLVTAKGLEGEFNVVSRGSFTLSEVASEFGSSPTYGSFQYEVPLLDNTSAAKLVPGLKEDSFARFCQFARIALGAPR
jgi:hypothetical protein